jgi:pimeloyl-ACP methyl ester carboxylesterase
MSLHPAAPEPTSVREGLAVYRFGHGDPVLLMPGPHRFQRPGLPMADALIDGLTGLGRSVITYDPPGSGRSTRPACLGVGEIVTCTDEALRTLGVTEPLDALGHSMGGLALLAYALERPRRTRSLVLVSTGAGGPAYVRAPGSLWAPGQPGFVGVALLGTIHRVLRRLATERLLNNHVQRWSFADPARAIAAAPVRATDWLRREQGRADWHRVARGLDYRPQLHQLTMPVLILCGRQDPQFPPRASAELAAAIPRALLHWFDDSGHYPFIEEAAPFWAVVAEFLVSGSGGVRKDGSRPSADE